MSSCGTAEQTRSRHARKRGAPQHSVPVSTTDRPTDRPVSAHREAPHARLRGVARARRSRRRVLAWYAPRQSRCPSSPSAALCAGTWQSRRHQPGTCGRQDPLCPALARAGPSSGCPAPTPAETNGASVRVAPRCALAGAGGRAGGGRETETETEEAPAGPNTHHIFFLVEQPRQPQVHVEEVPLGDAVVHSRAARGAIALQCVALVRARNGRADGRRRQSGDGRRRQSGERGVAARIAGPSRKGRHYAHIGRLHCRRGRVVPTDQKELSFLRS